MADCGDFTSGPVTKKKHQAGGTTTGTFKASWNKSVKIVASSKGDQFAQCKLC